jgi:zinc-ribbon domain
MGFFQRLKSNPKAEREFNQALAVYKQLRRYPEHSPQYREQLKHIASSSRNAIALNDRHGDAHVMLANTYFLMFLDGFPQAGDLLPLKYAVAVIQHWAGEPMRQQPWTKNTETGQTMYSQVADAVRTFLPSEASRGQTAMETLKATYYMAAVSRDVFGQPQASLPSHVSSPDAPPSLPTGCPHCGAYLVEGARFCMACGKEVAA